MDDQSPPKRVTRARATVQADTGTNTTKIATAASKAKATRTLSTTRRKTPVNDGHEDKPTASTEDIIEPQLPRPRGRPRKVAAPQPESDMDEIAAEPPKPTRGRPRKTPDEAPAPQPPRPRGRPRKVDTAEVGTIVTEAPAKTTRARAGTVSKPTSSKKSVQFEEPDKENIIPAQANEKGNHKEAATGLRAKPLRKPAVPATRATRSQPKAATQKSPLSPKKSTQITAGKDDFSDDELAGTGKTPTKPLAMSPVKPPAGIFAANASKKLDFSNSTTQGMSASVMASPARRPPSSPFKELGKTSPKGSAVGDCLLRSPVKLPVPPASSTDMSAPASSSLLRSPARRPHSPMKVAENGSPSRPRNNNSNDGANMLKISKFATPRTLTNGAVRAEKILGSKSSTQASVPKFSGRLSSILPRDSDPALPTAEPEASEAEDGLEIGKGEDPMVIDETVTVVGFSPPSSPPETVTGAFSLRELDDNPFRDSESEDEHGAESPKRSAVLPTGFRTSSSGFAASPATPTPFTAISKSPKTGRSVKMSNSSIGFTPLAKQLSDWMPASPDQRGAVGSEAPPGNHEAEDTVSTEVAAAAQPSPTRSSYFDDEMSVRDGMQITSDAQEQIIDDADFSPAELDEEDYALAHEADEMSLLEPGEIKNLDCAINGPARCELEHIDAIQGVADEFINPKQDTSTETMDELIDMAAGIDPATSEVSQEYGDENAIPIDPALLALDSQAPSTPKFVTPKRVLVERIFHTVSKVPLKGEAEASAVKPSPMKRSASVSKLPAQRPANTLARSNTVISYSPSKKARSRSPQKAAVVPDACATPSKDVAEAWSTIGTPARTPRRDLNPALLKGAVVFVDVHTTEGADASGLFIELLTQMGARCVKRWDWNGNKHDGSKIGITHVVFKDGGRRTLEKARETGGVISCVGVGWVLE